MAQHPADWAIIVSVIGLVVTLTPRFEDQP
jgi:hypothetical protein